MRKCVYILFLLLQVTFSQLIKNQNKLNYQRKLDDYVEHDSVAATQPEEEEPEIVNAVQETE